MSTTPGYTPPVVGNTLHLPLLYLYRHADPLNMQNNCLRKQMRLFSTVLMETGRL